MEGYNLRRKNDGNARFGIYMSEGSSPTTPCVSIFERKVIFKNGKRELNVQYAEPFLVLSGQSSVRRARAVLHWLPGGTPILDTKRSKDLLPDGGRAGVNISWTVLGERIGCGGVLPAGDMVG